MSNLTHTLKDVLLGIDHVGLAVRDLDAAIDRWESVMGLTLAHRETNTEQGVEEAMMAVGDGTHMQLLAPLSADSTIGKFLEKSGEGMQQLAFRVSDIVLAMKLLTDKGVRVIYPEPRIGTAGSLVNFVHPKDTGGVLLELVQPAEQTH